MILLVNLKDNRKFEVMSKASRPVERRNLIVEKRECSSYESPNAWRAMDGYVVGEVDAKLAHLSQISFVS